MSSSKKKKSELELAAEAVFRHLCQTSTLHADLLGSGDFEAEFETGTGLHVSLSMTVRDEDAPSIN